MNKRRKNVVDHSLSLFLEHGIRNTSIQDIIDRAGISKGTFYNYFSSKNECVGAILEQFHYESALSRSELLVGKDAKELELLIEQITLFLQLNEQRGINALSEEILHLGDPELKQLVVSHRLSEHEWLSERFIEVYGEELRPYAFESAVLFFGMLQHLLFVRQLLHPHPQELETITSSIFYYMEFVTDGLLHQQTAILDDAHLTGLKEYLHRQPVDRLDAVDMLEELRSKRKYQFSIAQRELTDALLHELKRSDIRHNVICALLQSFAEAFAQSPDRQTAKKISSIIWYDLKRNQHH